MQTGSLGLSRNQNDQMIPIQLGKEVRRTIILNSSLLLEPPKEKMLSTLRARSFYAAAPCPWNSLPAELRDIQSLCSFKQKLKTHLFRAG